MTEPCHTMSHADEQRDDESEYEYDKNETETFYVTLDLSSYSNPEPPKPLRPRAPSAAEEPNLSPSPPPEAPAEPVRQDIQEPALASTRAIDKSLDDANPEPQSSVHILDLDSKNPLVLYQGRTYSCNWGSTIGTDFIIGTKAPTYDDTYDPPLPSEPEAEILGLSTIRLTARPVQATLKTTETLAKQAGAEYRIATQHEETLFNDAPIQGEANHRTASPKSKQAAFLEKLASIKAAKGETDQVTTEWAPWNKKRVQDSAHRLRGRSRGTSRRQGGRQRRVSLRDELLQDGAVDARTWGGGTPARRVDLEGEGNVRVDPENGDAERQALAEDRRPGQYPGTEDLYAIIAGAAVGEEAQPGQDEDVEMLDA